MKVTRNRWQGGSRFHGSAEDSSASAPVDTSADRVLQFGHDNAEAIEGGRPVDASEPSPRRPSLGALLVGAGLVTDDEVKEAVTEGLQTGERLGEAVIRKGWASEERVAQLLAEQWGLPFLQADAVSVDPVALQRVPLAIARQLRALPIGFDGERVTLAITDPSEDLFAEVQTQIGEVAYMVVARSVLRPLIQGALAAGPIHEDGEPDVVGPFQEQAEPSTFDEEDHAPAPLADLGRAEDAGAEKVARVTVGAGGSAVGSVVEAALNSIDDTASQLVRIRGEVAAVGSSLALARAQLAAQEDELEAAEEAQAEDRATIRRLESELAQRAELFETLKAQLVSLTETLGGVS